MASTICRTSPLLRTAFRSGAINQASTLSKTTSRTKVTLPDLPYDYAALEPAISGRIMELHHKNHHQTYITNYNNLSEQLEAANAKGDATKVLSLQPGINFHGGGHVNHSLFWQNLAPRNRGGGAEPEGKIGEVITTQFRTYHNFIQQFNAELAGVQGSGWTWLVYDTFTKNINIRSYANQDPVTGRYKPLLGIDAWEHAYYLDYQNRKAEYFKAVWDVVNWKEAEKRFSAASAGA